MFKQYLTNRRLLAVLTLGFASGLPAALIGSTLQAWFTQAGINLMTIGALSLMGLPYIWKFLWSPLLDRFAPPFLGRRRGWIFITQLGLCLTLFLLANLNPGVQPRLISLLALLIAFISASQDIAYDAYRTDVLLPEERGLGAAAVTLGYRIAMLVSGGLGLIMADYWGWQITYEIMAVLMALSMLVTYRAPEIVGPVQSPKTLQAAAIDAIKDLLQRKGIIAIVLFLIFYKLGNALVLALMSNFLLHSLGFTLTEVGLAFKTVGILATVLGAFVGGALLIRLNLYYALLGFGLLQAFSNLMFMMLAIVAKSYLLLVIAIFVESFCSGMSTVAFVAFLMGLCNERYTATQYACLSALDSIGRVSAGPIAAIWVAHYGWINFFGWAFILSFPGLVLLTTLRSKVRLNAQAIF